MFNHPPSKQPAATSGSSAQFNVQTALLALRCWWHVALPAGILLAAVAAAVVFATAIPTYTATAWILIKERPPSLLQNSSNEDSRRYVSNQIELMRSPPLLQPIASDPEVASTPELAREVDPVQYLRNNLKVKAVGQSDYFEVAFTSRSAPKAALIVNKVANDYVATQEKQQNKSTRRTIELLQDQEAAQEAEVKRLRKELDRLSKAMFGKEAFPLQRQEPQPASDPVADLRAQLIRAEVEQAALSAEIQAEEELFLQESFEPSQTEVDAYVASHPRIREARELVDKSQRVLAGAKSVAANPKLVPEYTRQVAEQQAALDRALSEVRELARSSGEKQLRARKQDAIMELKARSRRLAKTVELLRERTKEERGARQELAGDSLEFEFVMADHDRAKQFLDAISSKILMMQTEQRAPERVEIHQSATVPTRVDEEMPLKKMGLAAGMGLLAPFGLAVLLEILFRRVSDRSQIESLTELALVGEVTTLPRKISHKTSKAARAGRHLQLYEESIDGLRTLLSLFESTRGHKVLSVTSAISGEGKTSLAAQLAVSIATATNRPTLLIDGDMRSPDIHRIFGVELGPGLSEILTGECPAEEALETEFSDNLHLLTAGRLDRNPHRLMGLGNFHQLVEKMRQLYDYVIIDTPPVLPASESLLMSSAADSTILCVRRDFSRVDQMTEASKRLKSSGIRLAGAVLSGVPVQQYASRYGAYYYTRARDGSRQGPVEPTNVQAS